MLGILLVLVAALPSTSADSTRPLEQGFRVVREHFRPAQPIPLAAGSQFTLPRFENRAREALVSWNLDLEPGAAARIEARVGRWDDALQATPWLFVGYAGAVPATKGLQQGGFAQIDVDVLRSEVPLGWIEVRVSNTGRAPLRMERIDITLRDRQRRSALAAPPALPHTAPALPRAMPALQVPARSQRHDTGALGSRLCSPTSVSMVLAYHGIELPTLTVAASSHDALHDIYGNWPRNVQAAFEHGLEGYLTAIARWSEAEALLARGIPLVISIAAGEGELRGAPYARTGGHLLVLRGVDARGDLLAMDPASSTQPERTYRRSDLTRCWLARGGTCYVLLGPRRPQR
jgi:hypothetical protein